MMRPTVLVAGHGMVGQRFLAAAVERGVHTSHRLVVVGEEPHIAYDRVHLSSLFDGASTDDLALATPEWFTEHGIERHPGRRVASIDCGAATVTLDDGHAIAYDHLVLATGSSPFVPPVPGTDRPTTFVYRTLEDLAAIKHAATAPGVRTGAVIGGGLLGLEAANALALLGLETHVVEFADRLMPAQLDVGGSAYLRREIESRGIAVHCAHGVAAIGDAGLEFGDGTTLGADVVVIAAGIRPRDELARDAGLVMGERGGVLIDDTCRTSDVAISAIGEVASHGGRVYGLVGPGYAMAEVVAARLGGDDDATFTGARLDAKLKLAGVEVASFGDAHATTDGCDTAVVADPVNGRYASLTLHEGQVIGGVLVGDTSAYAVLAEMACGTVATPKDPLSLVLPATPGGTSLLTPAGLPDGATICSCHNVTKGTIGNAIRNNELADVGAIKACTKAGTGCGSCVPVLKELLDAELILAGKPISRRLCEHFAQSRQELFDLVRLSGLRRFADLVHAYGTGLGCEICKPAVASMFASLGSGYILDGEQGSLQDTNDHFLANIQRDGTYSVVPRVPGGEITPDKLIVLGEVARDFDLYTKITGAQRIDLFGARYDQLPAIWERLVDAGFESGHAYGKALRTVKSCVGSTWCRYGVQDSVGMAITLELRYRGLRAPHKMKMAVSGCARECAEAQGKDIGVIATERGYNLYVCGNGGMRPQHALLFAEDLDEATLLTMIDRVLMFYIRTADRLERTATWFNKLDGGIEYLRSVVIDDALGIVAELDAAIAHHVDTYVDEWAATLASPERLARFRPFVNDDEPDESRLYIRERGQRRPARADDLIDLVGPPEEARR
jgi:nitrite reductase (NADH) large subunit